MVLDFLLIFQIFIALFLIFVILLQKMESDSVSGFSYFGSNIIFGKSSDFLLKKITVILALFFMLNSLFIAKNIMNSFNSINNVVHDMKKELGNDVYNFYKDSIVPKY